MRTIKIFEHISLDGVIQPGGPNEDSEWSGQTVLADSADPREFTLVSSKATPTGALLNTCRHART